MEETLPALACWSSSASLTRSTDVEPSRAWATSGRIWIVIIGTDDDPDEPSDMRDKGATASRSWGLLKLIVTRLVLFELWMVSKSDVAAGIVFRSCFARLKLFAVVMGSDEGFTHA